jgi:hypothetical protein
MIRLIKKCRQALVDYTTQVDLIDECDLMIDAHEASLPKPESQCKDIDRSDADNVPGLCFRCIINHQCLIEGLEKYLKTF